MTCVFGQRLRNIAVSLAVVLVLILSACAQPIGEVRKDVPDGDPVQGREAILYYGCGSCHTIPGVPGADTFVGPPLNQFHQRHYIAGRLPNTAANLIEWIQHPQLIEPGTAMPNLGVSESEARDIAAYLYSQ